MAIISGIFLKINFKQYALTFKDEGLNKLPTILDRLKLWTSIGNTNRLKIN